MARGTRLDAPGALHHVTARGIESRAIFRDDRDRRAYVAHLARTVRLCDTTVLAWALMSNHVHLLLRTGTRPLHQTMQMLGTRYARDFNRRHRRSGYLFQGRYHSSLIDEDGYLLAAIRYVHRNPVEAGVLRAGALDAYPWTGHSALLGRIPRGFQAVAQVLTLFDADPTLARRRLCSWMGAVPDGRYEALVEADADAVGDDTAVVELGAPLHRDARALGSPAFAERMLGELCGRPRPAALRRRWDLGRVVRYVCEARRSDPREVCEGRRAEGCVDARAVIAYLAHHQLEITLGEVAAHVGVSRSALSRGLERGRVLAHTWGLTLE